MSNSTSVSSGSVAASSAESEADGERVRHRLSSSLKPPIQFACFWLAVFLPFLHVPLLAQGLDSQAVTMAFFALLAVNVLTLYIGHGYEQ